MGDWTVLLIEDNDANRMLVTAILSAEGVEVVAARTAEEARRAVDERAFDLILLDIQLPGIDGLTLVREFRAVPGSDRTPIIAVTANAMTGTRERALAAGCQGFVTKPINTRAFREEVLQILS